MIYVHGSLNQYNHDMGFEITKLIHKDSLYDNYMKL